jgi:signal transduction histidine kinase/ActR/RegA family two-component response regulator
MRPHRWPITRYQRITQICGLLIILIGGLALVGWFIDSSALKDIRANYIPMAPNTALAFILLGALLTISVSISQKSLLFIRAGATLIGLLVITRLVEYSTSADLKVDQWLFRFPSDALGLAPVGKMAFFTALTFLFVAVSLLLLTFSAHRRVMNDIAKGFSVIICFIGLAFALGYFYGAPLMYGTQSIPMALNTATAFFFSGLGLLVKASIRDLTERRQTEAALQQAHDELEARVEERTEELTQAVTTLQREVAERKAAEEALRESEQQLRMSQRLEAVGQLAGGVAHDFNNLLTVITGYSDLILTQLKEDDPLRHKADEVRKAAERAASLTRQLLAFSRKQVLQPKVLDLNSLVAEMSKMLRRLIGEDIELILALKPALARIKADPGQVEQVLMNLLVNARDAMPQGGKMVVETAQAELSEAYADMHIAVTPGQYVMLAVSDTGEGMDAETQKHIFEPFFTTKEVGKGTGLGLATVYGIVKQSGGNIWVYSEKGRGTTFKIYLPRVEEEAEHQSGGERVERLRGTETILLVEDEAMVRKLTRSILEENGYRVLEAANGEEALRLCSQYQGPIHLMVTDVVMPLMNGRELAQRMLDSCREVRVLYMSGYTDDAIVHHGVLDPSTHFLEKPFTPDALARKVREVLEKA